MKTNFSFLFFVLLAILVRAQAPQSFRYQAVLRDAGGQPVCQQNVILEVSFSNPSGVFYIEEHSTVTSNTGMVALSLGSGSPVQGDFAMGDWKNGNINFHIEMSTDGGSTFTAMGDQVLESVPYALYADEAGYYEETDPIYSASPVSGITSNDVIHWSDAYSWGDHSTAGYITSYTETDPFYTVSVASTILQSDMDHWNDAYGWGNHNAAGYLTSYSETDPSWSGSDTDTAGIWRNGNVGIGTTAPAAMLHTMGTGSGEGNVVFEGSFKSTGAGQAPVSGAGTRFMWYPDKAAIRAGGVSSTQWDSDSIGNYSCSFGNSSKSTGENSFSAGFSNRATGIASSAMGFYAFATGDFSTSAGLYTVASGISSVSLGERNEASGDYSAAFGLHSTASGDYSFVAGSGNTASGSKATSLGSSNLASGNCSFACGSGNTVIGVMASAFGNASNASGLCSFSSGILNNASGDYSSCFGSTLTAPAYAQTTIGCFNITVGAISSTTWAANDHLFVVGNGSSFSSRSNALTLYKNGNMTISGTLTQSSDVRLKTNIRPVTGVLAQIQEVQPIYYEFKNKEQHPDGTQLGFSAQEIRLYWPELVREDPNGYLSVDYAGMSAVLLQAVKEQQVMINEMKKEIELLKKQ